MQVIGRRAAIAWRWCGISR